MGSNRAALDALISFNCTLLSVCQILAVPESHSLLHRRNRRESPGMNRNELARGQQLGNICILSTLVRTTLKLKLPTHDIHATLLSTHTAPDRHTRYPATVECA